MQYPPSGHSSAQTHPDKELTRILAQAIEQKDRYTAGHVKRTAHYACKIARVIGGDLAGEQGAALLERVRLAGLLHDLGKIEIADAILRKNSELDLPERGQMREHPMLGFEILGQVAGFEEVADGIRYHHERWDGQGYPSGLAGGEIPWMARLIAVADAYDAMVSTRPYRKGLGPRVAYSEILKQSGTQFDPAIVEAFAEAFASSATL